MPCSSRGTSGGGTRRLDLGEADLCALRDLRHRRTAERRAAEHRALKPPPGEPGLGQPSRVLSEVAIEVSRRLETVELALDDEERARALGQLDRPRDGRRSI